jgi:hypothetical protein
MIVWGLCPWGLTALPFGEISEYAIKKISKSHAIMTMMRPTKAV